MYLRFSTFALLVLSSRYLHYIKSLTLKNTLHQPTHFLIPLLWPLTLTGVTEILPQRKVDFVAKVPG
jgi:hypothetical protein